MNEIVMAVIAVVMALVAISLKLGRIADILERKKGGDDELAR